MAVYNPSQPPPGGSGRGRQPAHPHAHLRLTHADRDTAADQLKEAYADGRLDDNEFDERLNQVMAARVQADLVPLFTDLAPAPAGPRPVPPYAGADPKAEEAPDGEAKGWAFFGHFSGYFAPVLGPLLILILKGRTSNFIRRQAMEALNYQITFLTASVLITVAWILVVPVFIWLFMLLGYVFLPLVAGLSAAAGLNWRYPLIWRPVRDNDKPGPSSF